MKIYILILFITNASAFCQADYTFASRSWSNEKGAKFEAKLHQVKKDVILLRAAKGGQEYEVKKQTLSQEDIKHIDELSEQTKDLLNRGEKISPELLYQAASLGLEGKWIEKASGHAVSGKVESFKISTDKLSAEINFEGSIFVHITTTKGAEFFEKEKALLIRGRGSWGGFGVNGGSDTICRAGEMKSFKTKGAIITFGRSELGVSSGVLLKYPSNL